MVFGILDVLPVVEESKGQDFCQHRVETNASGVILAKAGRNALCRISSSRKRETNFCGCGFPKKWRTEARGSLQSRRASIDQCTKFRFSLICPPVRYLLGLPPQTRLVVLADYISFVSARVRKRIHSVARPLPSKSCDFEGYPMSAAEKTCPNTCVLDKNCPLQFERS